MPRHNNNDGGINMTNLMTLELALAAVSLAACSQNARDQST